ncbi:glycosyltransferase family 2 protein [Flavobacterium luminosum]|uniref:Glycosyltransferase family 2 protein n=1 Tax=Flavobacterium luminosum TaxID=2949086 RepID=A0ABT0TLY5_9FLAO|nr:glycosyltransferase family 2 protein [Flavobacterium sp. HXWNR70]MCL9808509.1 glycosyltransferase family 2 protein [Flavobacterium sp. HXWNR70]
MDNQFLVTIFIPVFNGEKYLERTLLSVLNQSYSNFEVLLVDDSSTDKSLAIVNNFAEKDSRFKVFSKPNGGMTSISWNYILPKIKGNFLFYLSQDDLLSEDLLEKAIIRHKETNADCVLCDAVFYFENKEGKRLGGVNGDRNIILNGRDAFLKSLKWEIHGFGLYKTKLYESEIFPEDAFDSDEYMTRKIFLKCQKVAFCDSVFYYRQDNPKAITKSFSEKNFYRLNTFKRIWFLIVHHKFDSRIALEYLFGLNYNFLALKCLSRRFNFNSKDEKIRIDNFLKDFQRELININTNFDFKQEASFKLKLLFMTVKNNFVGFIFCLYQHCKK